jgi:hypothetical protein
VWVSTGDEPPTRPSEGIADRKILVTTFFSGKEMLHISFLPERTTMNSKYFRSTVLAPLLRKMKKLYSPLPPQIYIHYDNAPPHRSTSTRTFLEKTPFTVLRTPPYSPDLAPSDFFLFGFLKGKLQGHTFEKAADLEREVRSILSSITKNVLRKTFDKWYERCTYVAEYGHYYPE